MTLGLESFEKKLDPRKNFTSPLVTGVRWGHINGGVKSFPLMDGSTLKTGGLG